MAAGDIAYRAEMVVEYGAEITIGFVTSLAGNRATAITWGKTSTVEISKDRATFAATTNSPVEVNDSGATKCGWHYLILSATELSASLVFLKIIPDPAEADEVHIEIHTVGNNNTVGNIRNIAADVRLIKGSAAAASATGYLATDARRVDGVALASHTAGYYPVVSGGVPSAADVAAAVWNEVLTGATYNIVNSAGRRLRQIQESGGYEGGAIWIDTVNGTAGTTAFENGTFNNPVDTLADALTLSATLGTRRFIILAGSTITLNASTTGYYYQGQNWDLALNGQAITDNLFEGATVSGTSSGSGNTFSGCDFADATTIPPGSYKDCGFRGTHTLLAGDYFIIDGHSQIAGATRPVIDCNGAAINLNCRDWIGGIEVHNKTSGNTSIDLLGTCDLDATCTGGTVVVRGVGKLIDDSVGATVTDLVVDEEDIQTILTATSGTTNAQLKALLTVILGNTS